MEYAQQIDDFILDDCYDVGCSDLYTKHVGFQDNNPCMEQFYSKNTLKTISSKITQLLQGVDPHNRPIIVPDKTIYSVMDSIYANYRPPTGDIYGRYNVPSGSTTNSYVQDMIDQVIEVITSDVRSNLGMEENNKKLSVWTTVLGDFNANQLRSHSVIKTLKKRPNPCEFHMRY